MISKFDTMPRRCRRGLGAPDAVASSASTPSACGPAATPHQSVPSAKPKVRAPAPAAPARTFAEFYDAEAAIARRIRAQDVLDAEEIYGVPFLGEDADAGSAETAMHCGNVRKDIENRVAGAQLAVLHAKLCPDTEGVVRDFLPAQDPHLGAADELELLAAVAFEKVLYDFVKRFYAECKKAALRGALEKCFSWDEIKELNPDNLSLGEERSTGLWGAQGVLWKGRQEGSDTQAVENDLKPLGLKFICDKEWHVSWDRSSRGRG